MMVWEVMVRRAAAARPLDLTRRLEQRSGVREFGVRSDAEPVRPDNTTRDTTG
ncbi:MAG: hypothetical protein ACRDPK_12425 [Carbonactinosporaceae bacterium]